MPGLVHFLRCVGRAVVKNGGKALARLVPFGEVTFEIAHDTLAEYRKPHDEPELRVDRQRLALAVCPDVRPVTITSPKRTYTVRERLAVGDVADVYLASAPNEPLCTLKVSRVPEGRALLDNERKVLTYLLSRAGDTTYRNYLPPLAESFAVEDRFARRVNVFLHEPGLCSLEQVHERHPALDGRHLAWIFKRLLAVLGFCHARGTLHAAVLPCHVLIHPDNHGLRLVGWGHSVETDRPLTTISTRYRDWYPGEVLKKQPATPATDLFLAARCLVYLAGGDPVGDRMPDAVPAPLQRFVRACLLEGARMRPNDAWKLHDEFDELLRQVYGPPKFHELHM